MRVLLTLDEALDAPDRPRISVSAEGPLKEGEEFSFGIDTPHFRSFLHLAYIQADGTVLNLSHSVDQSLAQFAPGSHVLLGDCQKGCPKFRVSKPFGNEMLIAVASRSPLFSQPRPVIETEREFLTALRRALALSASSDPVGRLIAADAKAVVTESAENSP